MNFISLMLSRVFQDPVAEDTRTQLRRARERIAEEHRKSNQFLGGHFAGCGATIGLMPRCDFACRGCYLGKEANRIPRAGLFEIKRQLRQIREWLGYGGNVQITDGEVTLLPEEELVEVIHYARRLGLVPMLMTHGDELRKRPELLNRLIVESNLSEVSVHIDITQRGRYGQLYRFANNEQELMALRDEFADIIRHARQQTGRRLEAATTVTITRDNIDQVADVIRWLRRNADAFKMISFQPVAQVGRTERGVSEPISVDELWRQIAAGLYGGNDQFDGLMKHKGLFGHPDCTRFVQGLVCAQPDGQSRFIPLFRGDDHRDQTFLNKYFEHLGGVSFRLDTRAQLFLRLLRIFVHQPGFMAIDVPTFVWRRAHDLSNGNRLRLLADWLRGKLRISYLNVISHHFMNSEELATPLGKEREESCSFKVPIGDEMVSMCAVNARGYRDRYYASLRSEN